MALAYQKNREVLFELLYVKEIGGEEEDLVSLLMSHHKISKKNVMLALEERDAVLGKLIEVDELLKQGLEGVEWGDVSAIEKSILRIAVYEMFYKEMPSFKIAISEAVRLAKKFANPNGAGFVNAVLDRVYKKSIRPLA